MLPELCIIISSGISLIVTSAVPTVLVRLSDRGDGIYCGFGRSPVDSIIGQDTHPEKIGRELSKWCAGL